MENILRILVSGMELELFETLQTAQSFLSAGIWQDAFNILKKP